MRLRLSIDGSLESVALIGVSVRAVCEHLGESRAGLIELSLVEAINNVIEHAYELRPEAPVTVTLERSAAGLVFEVIDHGRAMDPSILERAPADFGSDDADPLALAESGRGLTIIKMTMDEVRYRSGPEGNVLTMVLHTIYEVTT